MNVVASVTYLQRFAIQVINVNDTYGPGGVRNYAQNRTKLQQAKVKHQNK